MSGSRTETSRTSLDKIRKQSLETREQNFFLFQEKYGFLDWSSFLKRSFQIINHQLDPDVVILIDEEYLKVSEYYGGLITDDDCDARVCMT